MSRTGYSLAIAFVIHILFLFLSTFLVDNGPLPFLLDTRNTISLNMGPFSGGASKKISLGQNTVAPKALNEKSTGDNQSASQEVRSSGYESGGEGSTSLSGTGASAGTGEGTYDFGASAVSYKEPIYPRQAIRRELEGTVRIRVKISPEGMPFNTEILKTSGHEILDKAATDAVSSWKFQVRGVFYFVEKNIVFKLQN